MVSMMGGRVAEAIALDDISTGASNDLQRATQICRDMVAKYGMSEELGPVVYTDENNEVFLGKDYGHVNNYSEETSARIDEQIEKLMRQAYDRTYSILKEHYDKLDLVAKTLMAREKINAEEFDALMKTGELPETETEKSEPDTNAQPVNGGVTAEETYSVSETQVSNGADSAASLSDSGLSDTDKKEASEDGSDNN